jgi:DNA-binding response OmpR family regulator
LFIVVDDRKTVTGAYVSRFDREGVASTAFAPQDFREWVDAAPHRDLAAIEAVLLGEFHQREPLSRAVKERCRAPIIAVNDAPSLDLTLRLFAAGVDDVVRNPIHIRELLARADAIRRRAGATSRHATVGEIRIYADGRDPEVRGETFLLPRRERRILEFLVANRGKRVTKAQIFNSIYGIFDEEVEENVVESHVSKLRKKLRERLGYDPIDSKRFLGYLFQPGNAPESAEPMLEAAAA